MKRNLIANLVRSLNLVILIAVAAVGCFAQESGGAGGRLEGTWDAQVSVTNCVTGDVIVTFPSIASFMQGGTSIGSTGGMPQSLRTPEHGVWAHVKANIYEFRFKTFSFSAQNVPTGWSIVRHTVVLDSSGDTYTSSGTAQHFAPNGVQVGSGCSSAIGTRFTL